MPNQNLINFINENRGKGLEDKAIRESLAKTGWGENDINEAFGLYSASTPETPPKPTVEQKPLAQTTIPGKRTKIPGYSICFLILLPIHLILFFAYTPFISPITAGLCLIILGLLFYEIYKKYKYTKSEKYLLIIFVIVWGLAAFSQVEYIPAKQVTVTDVFGNPLKDISVGIQDKMIALGGFNGNNVYRFPKKYFYSTDENGQVKTSSRLYFGQSKIDYIYMPVNNAVFGGPSVIEKINRDFDSKNLQVHKETNYQIYLAPIKEDYKKCDSISDGDRKNDCLVYALFYGAVRENNPELCRRYGDKAVRAALQGEHFFYLSRGNQVEKECLMFVGGVLQNNPKICDEVQDEVKDGMGRAYNKQCNELFYWGSECESSDSCKELKLSMFNDTHNYICGGEAKKGGPVVSLSTAIDLYEAMFCNQSN